MEFNLFRFVIRDNGFGFHDVILNDITSNTYHGYKSQKKFDVYMGDNLNGLRIFLSSLNSLYSGLRNNRTQNGANVYFELDALK